ncbi:hypothetical protein ACJZ2D_011240 [Fusarium nematophilum]
MPADVHGSADERPLKRAKRGKYIMRAWVLIDEILVRIGRIETQMKTVAGHLAGRSDEDLSDNTTTDNHEHAGSYVNVENEDSHTFVGESCSIHSLRLAEAKLDQLGVPIRSDSPLPPARPLTPMLSTVSAPSLDREPRSWLRTILRSHGVVPDKRQWDVFSRVYLDEIHGIYPLLHPPTVRQTYDYLWERSFLVLPSDLEKNGQSRVSIAIVFLCVALGRCLASSRTADADVAQSAGWSLYSVAMHLLHHFLDMTQDHPMTLNGLQAYAHQVIYLFRLDAKEKADRALANAISSAHVLGLHRKGTYAQMRIFQDEMFARIWWCLYAFDRRLSLGSGRPPIIQDVDYDTQTPRNLGDEWLEQHKSTRATAAELEDEIKAEMLTTRNTPIPYLGATISFSKVCGDVWKAVYGLHVANRGTPGIVHDYLDLLLENWRQSLPPRLKYEADRSYEDQFSGLEWWQVKECLFGHMRYMFLKLQIRRPVAASTGSATTAHEGIANESARAQLACSIIRFFQEIPEEYPKYVFSLMDYMMSATIVLVAIVVQNAGFKDRYRTVIVAAVQSIALYCRKTWVSGKTIRVISRLDRMVRNTFGPSAGVGLDDRAKHRSSKERLTREGCVEDKGGSIETETTSKSSARAVARALEEHHPPEPWPARPGPGRGCTNPSVTANPWSASDEAPSARLDPSLPLPENRNSTATSTASLQGTPRPLISPPDTTLYGPETPQVWPSETARNDFDDLLSLATADFDFEQAFSGPSYSRFGNPGSDLASFDIWEN